jgi:hypothetical protein
MSSKRIPSGGGVERCIKIEIGLQHNWERAVLLNSGLQQDHQAISARLARMLLPKSVNNFVAYAQSYSTPVPANEPRGVRVGSPGTIEIEPVEARKLLI